MRSAIFVVPVWLFGFAFFWVGMSRYDLDAGMLNICLGGLCVCIANVFMLQHRRIAELERRLQQPPDADSQTSIH